MAPIQTSSWSTYPNSDVKYRYRIDQGERTFQVDNERTPWLDEPTFKRKIKSREPRDKERHEPSNHPAFRSYPPPKASRGATGPMGEPVAGGFTLFGGNEVESLAQDDGPVPGNDRRPSDVATRPYRPATVNPPDSRPRNEGPRLSLLAQRLVDMGMGNYPNTIQFISENPALRSRREIESLNSEALITQQAGQNTRAQTCVHHALLLKKWVDPGHKDVAIDTFRKRMIAKDPQTIDGFIRDVKKVYSTVQTQATNATPLGPVANKDSQSRQNPVISQPERPEPTAIPTTQRPVVPEAEMSLPRTRQGPDGRLYYFDDRGNILRPANSRAENDSRQPGRDIAAMAETMAETNIRKGPDSRTSGNRTQGQENTTPNRQQGNPGRRPSNAGSHEEQKLSKLPRTHIGHTKGDKEKLDARYRKRVDAKTFFALGKVFALLWHEGAGNGGGGRPTELSNEETLRGERFGEKVYSHIRRMVVVKEGHGFCWCLPVNTYNGQGVTKPGLSRADREAHSIIYMSDTSPECTAAERPYLIKKPIAVNKASADQKLDYMSRINFSKIYTIEHNVKVMNVGHVTVGSMPILLAYWRNTLDQ